MDQYGQRLAAGSQDKGDHIGSAGSGSGSRLAEAACFTAGQPGTAVAASTTERRAVALARAHNIAKRPAPPPSLRTRHVRWSR
jgi:hypothetical protein